MVFCSDDGFKNNLRGAQILSEFGARCCFFINPATIENSNRDFLNRFCTERLDFPPVEFLDWHEVSEIQKFGHEIGSHSLNHIRISQKSREEVLYDLSTSLKVLNQNCGTVRHFAYPYGRFYDFSKEARDIVFDLGFYSCASSERGCHVNHFEALDNRRLCLRRDH
ncbi:MAG: polysaccharide deacetylase family protein, partial [Flammeovirgaceae bacterium]